MRVTLLLIAAFLVGCKSERPTAPTQEQSAQLNEMENALNEMGNEEGPERSPGPSNSSD